MTKFMLYLICLLLPLSLLSQSVLHKKYVQGHQKEWTEAETKLYKEWEARQFNENGATVRRQDAIMNGNKVLTEIWNYGSISSPGNGITDIVWEGLGYGYEFAPFVAAEVEVPKGSHPDAKMKRDENGNIVTDEEGNPVYVAHVISDGLKSNGGEISTDATTRWGWQPMAISEDGVNEFLNPDWDHIPTSDDRDRDSDGKPDSWPAGWYNNNLRDYVWPGALGQGATNADKESFFVMDDRDNKEFTYFPYPDDSLRQGLGLEVEARYYQWSNVEAEDAIFLIYKIRNKGYYDLEKCIFGMWGDPHIGGTLDYRDDWANYDRALEMTFAYDADNYSLNNPSIIPGYLGYKFLESPGLANDGIDNDEDGMIDESWTDGIDNDNDWNVDNDDVGIDGVPNTGDEGEKDGMPTAGDPFDITKPGEPNYEFTDIDESDMIGLTSFAQPLFSNIQISDDEGMWRDHIQPNHWDTTDVQGDYVFLYGSGQFTLKSIHNVEYSEISEAIKRFSIALLLGEDRGDLVLNAKTVQRIYNSGYQFAKPPAKPALSVIPGDRKVTLYWDDVAESSVDPISKANDFEGYIIYRSLDPGFLDQQTITDINGNKFLFEPLKTADGAPARFDRKNNIFGPSKVQYPGRGMGFYLGDDTGLRHVFVDSNQVYNGQTYFYALVSYDHGSDSLLIPPSECSKIITFDPTTNEYTFDINTARVVPRRRAAGYVPGKILTAETESGVVRRNGYSTGTFNLEVIDDRALEDDNEFLIRFTDTTGTEYSVEDMNALEETFVSFYGNRVSLSQKNINDSTVVVSDPESGTVYEAGRDYVIDGKGGSILVFDPLEHPTARMEDDREYHVKYRYFPIIGSKALNGELTNPVVDGVRLSVKQAKFGLNKELSGWSSSSQTTMQFKIERENSYAKDPYDYEFRFSDDIVDTTITNVLLNFRIYDVINNEYMTLASPNYNDVWEPGDSTDVIYVLRGGTTFSNIVWRLKTFYPDTSEVIPPGNGDLYYLATDKPFQDGDVFSYTTIAPEIDQQKAENELDRICVVPNPYVATNVIEPSNKVERTTRGYRRLYFDHLPRQCTIRIYTQAGDLVKIIEHNSAMDDGKAFWDLLSRDNIEVAYGLYFFHVDAPGIGEKVGKFAIIK